MKRATERIYAAHTVPLISIHALVKRATQGMRFLLFGFAISIHALVKRATQEIHDEYKDKIFQSTPS